jgi:hypothetical protein
LLVAPEHQLGRRLTIGQVGEHDDADKKHYGQYHHPQAQVAGKAGAK